MHEGSVMIIAIVSTFYSNGMGYTENCLPRALASLGHDVHVITSRLNVYGNSSEYSSTYEPFLGPADQGVGEYEVDGYTVHRLNHRLIKGYVFIEGLQNMIGRLRPSVVHCTEIASLPCYALAALKPIFRFKLFTETHHHLSVVRPFLKQDSGAHVKKMLYRVTRTVPTALASHAVETCYAIAPDCIDVATRFFGVPRRKLKLQGLGTDTELFRPAETELEKSIRSETRRRLGYSDDDAVYVYTGRFSEDKNPLVLARAVDRLSRDGGRFHALFVGGGAQARQILESQNCTVLPFTTHSKLADIYRAADVAVWPRQESMSMLDAAASGLPLIVSDRIGDMDRVAGNGVVYREDDLDSMCLEVERLSQAALRRQLGATGRDKMVTRYSWASIARSIASDYATSLR
jgi:glycosyltransferase involved in cell wall biosynthesis